MFCQDDSDSSEDSDAEEKARAGCLAAPRMFLEANQKNKYQLRAYIYQARSLPAADDNSRSGMCNTVLQLFWLLFSVYQDDSVITRQFKDHTNDIMNISNDIIAPIMTNITWFFNSWNIQRSLKIIKPPL